VKALGFDLGTSTGVAVAVGGPPSGITIWTKAIVLGKPGMDPRDRVGIFVDRLDALIDAEAPDIICYEEVGFGVSGRGALWIRREEGVLLGECHRRGILVVGLQVPTLKAWAGKQGAARKGKIIAKTGAFNPHAGPVTKEGMHELARRLGWVGADAKDDESDAAWAAHWGVCHAATGGPDS
jgi:Holliday junction resolvasome RuvABC endonuclease subunit